MITSILGFLDYLFSFNPSKEYSLQWVIWLLVAISIAVIITTIVLIKKNSDKIFTKLFKEYPGKLITLNILLIINVLARLNHVQLFSMRFLTYTLSAWILFTFYEIFYDWTKKLPALKNTSHQKQLSQVKKYHIHRNKKPKTRA